MLEVKTLASHYGRIPALKGIDLAVQAGELVALVGANSAGKTTLLRAISGLHPPSAGQVLFAGTDITRQAPHRRVRLGIVLVPEGRQVFAPLSVLHNLLLGAHTRPRAERDETLERVYRMFPALAERRHHAAGSLSGGQQQMLAIGRGLMSRPVLLLLDEPSMGLAPFLVDEVFATVAALKRGGTTIFLVDQNARAALAIADRAYVLETGRITLSGTGAELLASPDVQSAYLGL
ncbi:MAG TPA: ABC transporter ATP-binding protein [Burkholderiales bacterium]|nr:ABC transporter ATP-binding protein [Burkholderiales bacterium]